MDKEMLQPATPYGIKIEAVQQGHGLCIESL